MERSPSLCRSLARSFSSDVLFTGSPSVYPLSIRGNYLLLLFLLFLLLILKLLLLQLPALLLSASTVIVTTTTTSATVPTTIADVAHHSLPAISSRLPPPPRRCTPLVGWLVQHAATASSSLHTRTIHTVCGGGARPERNFSAAAASS